jgi:hypothetical protein
MWVLNENFINCSELVCEVPPNKEFLQELFSMAAAPLQNLKTKVNIIKNYGS